MKHIEILEPWQAIAIAKQKKHVRYVREPARRTEKPNPTFMPWETEKENDRED